MANWRSRAVIVAILLAVPVTLANCGSVSFGIANAPAYFGSYTRSADIAYGREPRQTLDVYVPTGAARRPIVVFWYGGMWRKGTKEQYRFVGAALANAGYVAVLPDYRLYPPARFPQFIQDGALAVRWAHQHATEIGGDARALFLMGHSAGAHLAATLALDERYLREVGGSVEWVRGWIGLSGPYDLDPSFPRILREIFRAPYTAHDWQPILLVGAHSPPALLIHGKDDWVPVQQADLLAQALTGVGVPVDCRFYDGVSHFGTVAAFAVALRAEAPSLADVRRFIDGTAAGTVPVAPCPDIGS
ncbi:MAG TPA: alpha/beta hydrolase [Steroidobacteraceae bacterium]|nr:alpha/beta hydrolase [Steroidobacteraceae bacterium]